MNIKTYKEIFMKQNTFYEKNDRIQKPLTCNYKLLKKNQDKGL